MADPNAARNLPRPPTKRAGVIARSRAKYGKAPSRANVDATMKRTAKRNRIAAKVLAKMPAPPKPGVAPPPRPVGKPDVQISPIERPAPKMPDVQISPIERPPPTMPGPPTRVFAGGPGFNEATGKPWTDQEWIQHGLRPPSKKKG